MGPGLMPGKLIWEQVVTMLIYKGTSQYDNPVVGKLEYDFFSIEGEEDFGSLVKYYQYLWRRFNYFREGYQVGEEVKELSPDFKSALKEYNANACVEFSGKADFGYGAGVRGMTVTREVSEGIYDILAFQFFHFVPSDVPLSLKRGQIYLNKGYCEAAITYFYCANKLEPDNAEVYTYRGAALFYKGDYDHAIEDFCQVIKIGSNDEEVYIGRGLSYFMNGSYGAAWDDFAQSLEMKNCYEGFYSDRNNGLYKIEGYRDAVIGCFTHAIELFPDVDLLYTHRGLVFANIGDFDRAIVDWEAALKINPNDSNTRANIQSARRDSIIDAFLEKNPDLATLPINEWPEDKFNLLKNILRERGIGNDC